MDFYNELKTMSEEDRKKYIEERIESLEKDKTKNDFFGYQVGENNTYCFDDSKTKVAVDLRCLHKGYLAKGTKLIYGFTALTDGTVSNKGNYYFLNDDQYIYDFCEFISHHDIVDEYDFFDLLLRFLRQYFGYFKKCEREDMYQLFYDSQGRALNHFVDPNINWFHKKGNAMCTEYSVMAQNIMSVFGFDTYAFIGTQKIGKFDRESHAFNIVCLSDEDILIDFSSYVTVYNQHFEKLGESPFIGYIERFDDEFVRQMVEEERHLIFGDYNYICIGDSLFQIAFDRDRDYCISSELIMEPVSKQKKKEY